MTDHLLFNTIGLISLLESEGLRERLNKEEQTLMNIIPINLINDFAKMYVAKKVEWFGKYEMAGYLKAFDYCAEYISIYKDVMGVER